MPHHDDPHFRSASVHSGRPGLRILHLITRCIRGGAASLLLSITRELRARGHDLVIASGPSRGPEGTLEPEVRAAGIPFLDIPHLVRDIDPVRDVRALVEIGGVLRGRRFDLVHTHTSKAGMLGRWAARASGVRNVVHSPHGHVFAAGARIPGVNDRPGFRSLFYLLERVSAGLAARTLALTELERRDLIELGIAREDRTLVVPNGLPDVWLDPLPVDRARAREDLGLETDGPWIGVVGRLAREKGHDLVFDAFGCAVSDRPNLRMLVAGDGPERAALESKAARLGLASRVRFLGSVADVRGVYAALDLLVQGSHYEAFGLVLLEAMACGCPVIATRVGGVPEVVEDGVTGTLTPAGDPGKLAAAMLQALAHPGHTRSMAAAARTRVESRFTLSHTVDLLESVYQDVVAESGRHFRARALP